MEQYIIDKAILIKFKGEVTSETQLKNFDSLNADMQDSFIRNHYFNEWNELKPLWDGCMDIIEDKSLDTRLKGGEAEMVNTLKNSIRYSSKDCLKSVLEFADWYFKNKQFI